MLSITVDNRNLIVKINGEIDHHFAESMRQTIDSAFSREHAKNIVLDFSEVTFMDSSGIGMIIGRYKNATKSGGSLFIANISTASSKVFEMSGLSKIIQTFHSVDEALEQLNAKV